DKSNLKKKRNAVLSKLLYRE
ncbi:hypothetical protein Gasu_63310, partial [Galdieria sulphuraria]